MEVGKARFVIYVEGNCKGIDDSSSKSLVNGLNLCRESLHFLFDSRHVAIKHLNYYEISSGMSFAYQQNMIMLIINRQPGE
jgi:hypothetical protein